MDERTSHISIQDLRSATQASRVELPRALRSEAPTLASRRHSPSSPQSTVSSTSHSQLAGTVLSAKTQHTGQARSTQSTCSSFRSSMEPMVHPATFPDKRQMQALPESSLRGFYRTLRRVQHRKGVSRPPSTVRRSYPCEHIHVHVHQSADSVRRDVD